MSKNQGECRGEDGFQRLTHSLESKHFDHFEFLHGPATDTQPDQTIYRICWS